jgi:hypothetical protein
MSNDLALAILVLSIGTGIGLLRAWLILEAERRARKEWGEEFVQFIDSVSLSEEITK